MSKKTVATDASADNTPDNNTDNTDKNTKVLKNAAPVDTTAETKHPATNKKTAKNKTKEKSAAKKPRSFVSALAIFIALSAAGLAAYDFWLVKDQVLINAQAVENQNSVRQDIKALQQQLVIANNALANETRARESAQAEHQALSTAMQNISTRLGRNTVAWRMAEVEYLLTVANHRLTLAQDRETAIAIFETADQRIKAIGDTALLKVRQKISDELTSLRAMPVVDISGLAFRVGSLVNGVEQLPLMDKKRIAINGDKDSVPKPTDWQSLPGAVWNDIKSLVQVRRHQQSTEPLLPPEQAWYLIQNLKLKLEQARFAVMRRDTGLFQQHLKEASNWLEHYFERESSIVQSAQAAIKKMQDIELQPPLPDVSVSLRLLREVMNSGNTRAKAKSQTKIQAKGMASQ